MSPRQRFSVKFYMVAMLFILFDVEAVFLYPWGALFVDLGWFGFIRDDDVRLRAGRRSRLRVDEGCPRVVISTETRAKIDTEIGRYPQARGALLPTLHLVQQELGHIAPETAREVAETLRNRAGGRDGGRDLLQHVLR